MYNISKCTISQNVKSSLIFHACSVFSISVDGLGVDSNPALSSNNIT
jgi:hypothetical protein